MVAMMMGKTGRMVIGKHHNSSNCSLDYIVAGRILRKATTPRQKHGHQFCPSHFVCYLNSKLIIILCISTLWRFTRTYYSYFHHHYWCHRDCIYWSNEYSYCYLSLWFPVYLPAECCVMRSTLLKAKTGSKRQH